MQNEAGIITSTGVGGNKVSLGMIANTVDQFTGKYNVKRYFEKLEQRAKLDDWDEKTTLNIIKYRLTGDAYDYFKTNSTLDLLNYTDFKAKSIKRFSPIVGPGQALSKLNNCYQRHDENVNQYVTRLKLLGVAILEEDLITATDAEKPGLIKKADQLVLNQFKTGLSKHLLKNVGTVFMRDANLTIDKAEEYARQEELNEILLKQRQPHVQMMNVNNTSNEGNGCFKCGKLGHFARDCRSHNFRDSGNGRYGNNVRVNQNSNDWQSNGNRQNYNQNFYKGRYQQNRSYNFGNRYNDSSGNRNNNYNYNQQFSNQYDRDREYPVQDRVGTAEARNTLSTQRQQDTGAIPRRNYLYNQNRRTISSPVNENQQSLNSTVVPPIVSRDGATWN